MPAPAEHARAGPHASGELLKRVVSAAILAPAGLGALLVGGVLWDVVVTAAAGCVAFEWSEMARRRPSVRVVLIGLAMLVVGCGAAGSLKPAAASLAAGMALLVAWKRAGAAISCGAAFGARPGLALGWRRGQPGGAAIVLLVMLTVWFSDTGAYVAGRTFGGPKLAPSVSPSKTWSGAAGGLLAAGLLGAAFGASIAGRMLPTPHGWGPHGFGVTALMAGLLGIASQGGDLAESWAKRRFGVKDSGWLIPGHGGLLDRVDGLMVAAPAAALLLLLA